MRVGVASADWSKTIFDEDGDPVMGGSGWARVGQYVARSSLDIRLGVLLLDKDKGVFGIRTADGENHFDMDLILMQRYMHFDVAKRIPEARANGQIIVQDVDDWYWGIDPKNYAFTATHPKVRPDENVDHYRKIIARSSHVIASTPFLVERLGEINGSVHLFENYLDLARFRLREQGDEMKVGWCGSTFHRSGDLAVVKGLLNPYPLHHTGHLDSYPQFSDEVGVPDEQVGKIGFTSPKEYPNGFVFDVGIVPLVLKPFNDAKSWIKGLEYVASGIPFVASPSREYRRLKREYGVGRLAKKPKDWRNQLRALEDPDVRRQEAKENLEGISMLDLSIGVRVWDDLLANFSQGH